VGQPGRRPEIFAYGFRNPWRFGFDPLTSRLWAGDVGDATFEEIDIVVVGASYGWPHCEGHASLGCERPGDVDPIFTYPHHGPGLTGDAIIGGAFASGGVFAALAGDYFFGDLGDNGSDGALYRAVPTVARDGIAEPPAPVVTGAASPVDIVFGPNGALYCVAVAAGTVQHGCARADARSIGHSRSGRPSARACGPAGSAGRCARTQPGASKWARTRSRARAA
jgi:glucose/arabinose dehydrogenase